MYRTLEEIINITHAEPYIYSDLKKRYRYTNSRITLDDDYIYIPMSYTGKDTYELIENHLKNRYCKGFFIAKSNLTDEEYIKLLFKYSPENVFVVRNTYNTGFEVAGLIAKTHNPELIILAGTDGTKEIKDKICLNLKIENLGYESHWQKVIDPLLRYKEGQKFVLLDTNIDKKTSKLLADYNVNSTIVYAKSSIKLQYLYPNNEDYINEWALLASNNPKIIFAREDNDFLFLAGMENKIKYCRDVADELLKYYGVKRIKNLKEDKKQTKFIDSSNSLYTVKESIRNFISNKNIKNKRKIIIFSAINYLGKYSSTVHNEILSEISEDVDSLAIVCGAVYTTDMSYKNSKTIIKRVPNLSDDNIIAIKNFVNWRSENADCAYLIISGDKKLCTIV